MMGMGKYMKSLRNAKMFSMLEVDSRYLQVKVAGNDCENSLHTSSRPFLICSNAIRVVKRPHVSMSDGLLAVEVNWPFIFVYLDDMMILLPRLEEKMDHVRQVATFLHDVGKTFKLK